jgi:hypothetical protein
MLDDLEKNDDDFTLPNMSVVWLSHPSKQGEIPCADLRPFHYLNMPRDGDCMRRATVLARHPERIFERPRRADGSCVNEVDEAKEEQEIKYYEGE